jgi:hypothetical protein
MSANQNRFFFQVLMPVDEWEPWELPDDNSNPDDWRDDCDDD